MSVYNYKMKSQAKRKAAKMRKMGYNTKVYKTKKGWACGVNR